MTSLKAQKHPATTKEDLIDAIRRSTIIGAEGFLASFERESHWEIMGNQRSAGGRYHLLFKHRWLQISHKKHTNHTSSECFLRLNKLCVFYVVQNVAFFHSLKRWHDWSRRPILSSYWFYPAEEKVLHLASAVYKTNQLLLVSNLCDTSASSYILDPVTY